MGDNSIGEKFEIWQVEQGICGARWRGVERPQDDSTGLTGVWTHTIIYCLIRLCLILLIIFDFFVIPVHIENTKVPFIINTRKLFLY